MLAEVYIVRGRDAGKALELGPGASISVGRSFSNDVRLRDPQVSRVHFRVDVTATAVLIQNLSTGNGTYVNDQRVQRGHLADGDTVKIGSTELRILVEHESERRPHAPPPPPIRRPGRPKGVPIVDEDELEAGSEGEADPVDAEEEAAPVEASKPKPFELDLPTDIVDTPKVEEPPAENLRETLDDELPDLREILAEAPASAPLSVPDDDEDDDEQDLDDLLETRPSEPELEPAKRDGAVDEATRDLIPGFRIEAVLGGGSRGTIVYRATQLSLDRPVAIKALVQKDGVGERAIGRFLRESAAISRLPHPTIVTIHDAGRAGEARYLVMELLPGGSFATKLDAVGRLSAGEAVAIVLELARALAFAHERGIVHRGVNPWNVLADATGRWKLVDFGAARDLVRGGSGKTTFLPAPLPSMAYLAPEQLERAGQGDARSDIYSLAAVLHRAISGVPPIAGKTQAALAAAVAKATPAPLEGGDVTERLSQLVARALSKEPGLRPATMRDLATELEAWAVPSPKPRDAKPKARPR
jgi:hypothetical protein